MDEKLLFIYSGHIKIDLPQVLFKEYQVKTITYKSQLSKIIVEYKPQIILIDEFVPFKLIKKIHERFKFVPIGVIGYFEKPQKTEKFLELGISIINISQSESEINLIIKNLLWFSLSRQELWDEEYRITKSELLKDKILSFSKSLFKILIVLLLFIGIPKLYDFISSYKKIFYELEVGYINASDICVVNGRYILNDWRLRNLFEYEEVNDKLLKMYIPQEQLNSISINNNYLVAFSMFSDKIYLYKYPEFSVVTSTELLKNTTILSVYIDENNHLYLLDNKANLYEFIIKDNKFVFVSSNEIKGFFPIDVVVYKGDVYLLSDTNDIYKLRKDNYKKEKIIILSTYFDTKQYRFSSFGISDKWIYLISETEKKVIKLTKDILI
ncbi:MAG: hypothetical protein N2505_00635 [Endomicrobia bacterium]|nr:hypothetical protein [Endomicrobiia bacterium]